MRRFAELPDCYLLVSYWAPHPCGGIYEENREWIGPGVRLRAVPDHLIKESYDVLKGIRRGAFLPKDPEVVLEQVEKILSGQREVLDS